MYPLRARAQRSGARARNRSDPDKIESARIVAITTHLSTPEGPIGNEAVVHEIEGNYEHEHRPSG